MRLRSDEFEDRFPGLLATTLALAADAGTGVADVRLHSAAA
ncbi:hypothetical protein [Prauserella halophila]|nr:hypothetical protein [Prauserella halophila]